MGKGIKKDEMQNAATAQAEANQAYGNANQLYGSLAPQLEAQSVSPSGYSPSDMAAMRTGAMQSAGGTQAGATGAGRLYAARTRNSGGIGNAIASSARTAGQQLGQNEVGMQISNAKLKQQQRQQALGGLESLNATELGAGNQALGLSNQSLVDASKIQNPWLQQFDWAEYTSPKGPGSSEGSAGSPDAGSGGGGGDDTSQGSGMAGYQGGMAKGGFAPPGSKVLVGEKGKEELDVTNRGALVIPLLHKHRKAVAV